MRAAGENADRQSMPRLVFGLAASAFNPPADEPDLNGPRSPLLCYSRSTESMGDNGFDPETLHSPP